LKPLKSGAGYGTAEAVPYKTKRSYAGFEVAGYNGGALFQQAIETAH
jgi:hypothetical protein